MLDARKHIENIILYRSIPIESLCQARQPLLNRSPIKTNIENKVKNRQSEASEIKGIMLFV